MAVNVNADALPFCVPVCELWFAVLSMMSEHLGLDAGTCLYI